MSLYHNKEHTTRYNKYMINRTLRFP